MDKLIHGKSGVQKIVGLEVKDNVIEIFQQSDNGDITVLTQPHRYWILADSNIDGKFSRLKGELYYKYGTLFNNREDFSEYRNRWKNLNTFCIWNAEEAAMIKDGYSFFQGLKHKDVSILSFDIETVGIALNRKSFVVLISNTYRDANGQVERKLFTHDEYENQQEMIDAWCAWVREKNPSIICGHNIFGFDLPYLAHCSGSALNLGRDGSGLEFDRYESKFRKDGSQFIHYKKVKCYGRTMIDTMFLSIKYDVGRKYESYGLKAIIKHEKLERTDRQFYAAEKIKDNFRIPAEMEKIKAYAEHDADDALALYDLMAPPFFYMCPIIPKPFSEMLLSASGSKINALLVRAYLQDKHSIPKATPTESFQGALSFAVPGLYANCFKIDIASLYPNIIINYSVYDNEKDPKGYLLELVKTFKDNRLKLKKLASETGDPLYKQMDTTTKGILNSFYGFFSAAGLNFNNPECGSFITARGREILEYTIKWASGKDASEFIKTEQEAEEGECA